MKTGKNVMKKTMAFSMASLLALLMISMAVLPAGLAQADNIVVSMNNLPGSAGSGWGNKFGVATFICDEKSWNPATHSGAYYAFGNAFGSGKQLNKITGYAFTAAQFTFTITSAGSHNINIISHADFGQYLRCSDVGGPSEIKTQLWVNLWDAVTGDIVLEKRYDILVTTESCADNDPDTYSGTVSKSISVNLSQRTYEIRVGIYTSCVFYAVGNGKLSLGFVDVYDYTLSYFSITP